MSTEVSERLAAARAAVDRACQLLLTPAPGEIDRCSRLLEPLILELTACQHDATGSTTTAATKHQARRLAYSLYHARSLLEAASQFHRNWLRRLGEVITGYTGRGEPGLPEPESRIVIEA